MKNFPDHESFDDLEKRLRTYIEMPDDSVWQNIDAALRPVRVSVWFPWLDFGTSLLTIALLTLIVTGMPRGNFNTRSMEERRVNAPLQKDETQSSQPMAIPRPKAQRNGRNRPANPTRIASKYSPGNAAALNSVAETITTTDNNKISDSIATTYNWPRSVDKLTTEKIVDSVLTLKTLEIVESPEQKAVSTNERPRPMKKKYSFYAVVTPLLTFQRAVPEGFDGIGVTDFSNPGILSAERFGLSADIGVQGIIVSRLEYYGGLSFYKQNQTLRYTYQSANETTLESNGDKDYTVFPKHSLGSIQYTMRNIGLHAGALYHLYGKKLAHKVGLGISYQRGLIKNNSEGYKNAESHYFSYQIFYRNELRVSGKLRFFVQPTFIKSFHHGEKLNAPFHLSSYRAGIGAGILYDF